MSATNSRIAKLRRASAQLADYEAHKGEWSPVEVSAFDTAQKQLDRLINEEKSRRVA